MSHSYFITGTDTGVGKTLVASALVYRYAQQGLKSIGMKPVSAGCEPDGEQLLSADVAQLMAASSLQAPLQLVNPYAFVPPIAPHIAAAAEGVNIDLSVIRQAYAQLITQADVVVVEGVGGFCVPLGDDIDTADLAQQLGLPVIMVVGMRLGCINHALLTAEAIRARGLRLAAWVANRIDPAMAAFEENLLSLQQRLAAPCLGVVPWMPDADFRQVAANLHPDS